MSITGVISGTVDAAALKAAKIGISGAVPVVGNIFADATETIVAEYMDPVVIAQLILDLSVCVPEDLLGLCSVGEQTGGLQRCAFFL